MCKRIVFVSGTRADFGKIKSLISACHNHRFEVHVFATGMHMNKVYGKTIDEIYKNKIPNVFPFYNHSHGDSMDDILARTVQGFSSYVKDIQPHLIVVHGDRVESLAAAIVGSLNNILTAHIEGGEISGTIDEVIRHAVSKLCHVHFVSNQIARKRLMQMGENQSSIHIIGSPNLDIILDERKIPSLNKAKKRYGIKEFDNYAIAILHPVTTEYEYWADYSKKFVDALIDSAQNYVVIYPNNDHGSEFIFQEYRRLNSNKRFKIFPSIRFEYFQAILKGAKFIIGNSSCGVMEAPYYAVPTINIGSRQNGRVKHLSIQNINYETDIILSAIKGLKEPIIHKNIFNKYGHGNSAELFISIISKETFWNASIQKHFVSL